MTLLLRKTKDDTLKIITMFILPFINFPLKSLTGYSRTKVIKCSCPKVFYYLTRLLLGDGLFVVNVVVSLC